MKQDRAEKILREVVEKNQKKQQVIITHSNDIVPPHNGITSKTAQFIDSLGDGEIMKKVVDEITDNAIKLIGRVDKNV